MDTVKIVRAVSVLAVLVLVVGVAGALGDGITGPRHDGALVTPYAMHAFNPVAVTHVDFAVDGAARSNGIRDGYLLHTALLNSPRPNFIINPPPPVSTPEPGTLLMLAAGLGILAIGFRRRAFQS